MIYEKLFLDKIKEVFVLEETTVKLKQYQKDGLRSLYTQYSKKKPGFILNDPTNAGKRTQVAVFLRAVMHLLENPILIVSSNVEKWREVFCCWAEDISDILFHTNKLTSNAKILVTDLTEAAAIDRREWSVVVVDDSECSVKLFRPLKGLKAAFKIVLTSVDLKKNYKTFSTIYEWIDPAEKVSMEKFSRQLQAATNELERLVLLDWYFQDKVLRRRGVGSVSDTIVEHHERKKIPSRAKPASKKNKDATGTKVKRSKPKLAEEKPLEPFSDSIDFEFDTMSAPYVSNTFRKNKVVIADVDEEDGKGETNETATLKEKKEIRQGYKRKRARIIESDEDSDGDDSRTNNVNEENLKECTKITNENEVNLIGKDETLKECTKITHQNEVNLIGKGETLKECTKIRNENEVNLIAKDYDTKESVKLKISSAKNVSSQNIMPLFPFEMEEETGDITETACDMYCVSSQQNNDEISPISPNHDTDNVKLFISERINIEMVTNVKSKSNENIEMTESKELVNNEVQLNEMEELKAFSNEVQLNEMKGSKKLNNDVQINEIKTKEITPEKSVRDTCSQKNNSILEDKIKAMEENILNNFKGSILDCLF